MKKKNAMVKVEMGTVKKYTYILKSRTEITVKCQVVVVNKSTIVPVVWSTRNITFNEFVHAFDEMFM